MNPLVVQISKNRFNGEPCPKDLEMLITYGKSLMKDLCIEIRGNKSWAPWADKSYLSKADYRDPGILANVKAIDDTFALISFVARTEQGESIGYWRGPEMRPIGESALVYYDTEGQFRLCGSRFVEALFFVSFDDVALNRLREACAEWQVPMGFSTLNDISTPAMKTTPESYHIERYERYKNAK